MGMPAFSFAAPPPERSPFLVVIGETCAASAVGTMLAVAAAVLAAHAATATGFELAVGLGAAATVAGPALAMIVHGLDARRAARAVAGGVLLAPAAAVFYLFEDPRWLVGDAAMAGALATFAALAALCAWRLERRLGLWGWWMAALPAVGALWAIAALMVPATVWLEPPF